MWNIWRMLRKWMMMPAYPLQKTLITFPILLKSIGMTSSRLWLEEKLTKNLGRMILQEFAVLDSGGQLCESLCFLKHMMNILHKTMAHWIGTPASNSLGNQTKPGTSLQLLLHGMAAILDHMKLGSGRTSVLFLEDNLLNVLLFQT